MFNGWVIKLSSIRFMFVRKDKNMKIKEFKFDVEMIIDHRVEVICKQFVDVSTHRMFRGITFKDLQKLIKGNETPIEEYTKITFNIRGVNY